MNTGLGEQAARRLSVDVKLMAGVTTLKSERGGWTVSSSTPNILWSSSPVVTVGDGGLREGGSDDCLLKESTEDQPARTRSAAVEPEGELFQVGLQVAGIDRALVGAEDPPLEQASDAMNAWHRDMGGVVR